MIDARTKALISSGQASIEQMQRAGREAVVQAKSGRTPQIRAKSADVVDLGDRVLRFRASDETTDRMGDVIRQAGWHLEHYRANPVILWAHDGDSNPPVGRAVGVELEDTPTGPALMLDIEFASRKQHELADTTYELAKGGFLKANSVGFLPVKVNAPESEEERKELGLGAYGVEFVEAELLEDSIVSVPANPSALQNGLRDLVSRGRVGAKDAQRFERSAQVTEKGWERRIERMLRAIPVETTAEVLDVAGLDAALLRELIDALRASTTVQGEVVKELANLRYLQVPEFLRAGPRSGDTRDNLTRGAAELLREALKTTSYKE